MTLIGENIPLRVASNRGLGAESAARALRSASQDGYRQDDLATKDCRLTDQQYQNCDQLSSANWRLFAIIVSGVSSGLIAATIVLLLGGDSWIAFFAYASAGIVGLIIAPMFMNRSVRD